MYYSDLVKVYQKLESTSKRLEKIDIISEFLKKTPKENLKQVVYLLQGKIYPPSSQEKLGMSSQLILKVIQTSTGIEKQKIESLWRKFGDLGKVAEELVSKKHQTTLTSKKLTVDHVFDNIRKLPEFQGHGTVNKKVQLISELLTNSASAEARYIIRTVLEELRVGVAAGVIRDSIAKAFDKEVNEIEDSYNLIPDYGEIALAAKSGKLKDISLTPGNPIKAMLGIKLENIQEAFKALGEGVQAEYKLDGFRLNCHYDGKNIKLFTRNMEDVTKQFPDVVSNLKNVKAKSYILDAEAVGYDPKTKDYLPFQNISQRIKRKYDIETMSKKFPVELNIFDVVYYNNKNLMDSNLLERRKILEKIIRPEKYKIVLTKKLISAKEEEIKEFYEEALKKGMEGLMIKNINSPYKPGRYVNGWIKLKPIMEPLDLTITKAEWGEGKRSNWLSSFTLSCRDGNEFLEIGKVGTGIKEKNKGVTFKQLTKLLKPLILEQKGKEVIVKPKIIVEVAYEEIQKSPTYSSGYALRFPKLIQLRSDKPLKEINNIRDVQIYYVGQKGRK